MKWTVVGLGLLVLGMPVTMPARGQDATVDTARPFVAGATEQELFLRSAVGWPTYQAGVANGLFYRFDPDGYARFGPTEQLDADFWEVTCTPPPVECAARRGPLGVTVQPNGAPVLAVEALGTAARLRLGGVDAPARTIAELSSPSGFPDLLKASVLLPAGGGEPVPIDGLAVVLAYMQWVEAGQPEDLRLDAVPRRQAMPEPLADVPAGTGAPPERPAAVALMAPEPQASPGADHERFTGAALPGTDAGAEPKAAAGLPAQPRQAGPSTPTASATRPAGDNALARQQAPPAAKARSSVQTQEPAPALPSPSGVAAKPQPQLQARTSGEMACTPGGLPQNALISKPVGSLRGLAGLQLVTDFLTEPENLKGKLRPAVRELAEKRLQAAGVRLFRRREVEQVPGKPRLELYFTKGDTARGCPFRIWMSLRQEVGLARDTGIRVITGTWGDGGVARPGPDQGAELETFAYYLDRFVKEWRNANGGQPDVPGASSSSPTPMQKTDAFRPAPIEPEASVASVGAAQPAQMPGSDDPDLVLGIQKALGDAGYNPGTADGVAGRRTRSAIRAFERDHELPVTGVASRTVFDRLLARRAEPLP